jgi:uridine kinase
MIEAIVKRDGRLVPFDPRKITFAILRAAVAVGGRDQELAGRVADRVVAELERRRERAEALPPSVEEVQDTVEKMLIEGGHAKTAKAYILYRYEHSLKRSKKESLTYSSENVPYRKLWEALSWALDKRCHSLAQLGEALREGRIEGLIRDCEEFYAREIQGLLEGLLENLGALRLLIIAGPSSSGKTTTTIKISQALKERGKRLVPINADNYFFDRDTHPKDPFGDYDFETPQALDLALLNEHLRKLVQGDAVEVPCYNFKTGRREGCSPALRLAPYFPGFIAEFSGSPDRGDALARAERIQGLFSQIPDWGDESLVPPESLLREFIGGSSYQYH